MFCRNHLALTFHLSVVASLLAGCNTSVEPTSDRPVSLSERVEKTQTKTELGVSEEGDTASESDGNDAFLVQSEPEPPAYEPPFPGRVDLFKVPKRRGGGSVATPEGIEGSVELIGFVNVDSQQVVLSIDGMVTPMEEGGKIAGIEVISIQPPTVLLQRGKQRWQEALEN